MNPQSVPTPGFYYHYKHDPAGSFENYAYEVMGVGLHTEMPHEGAEHPEDGMFVVYRPLYESAFVYKLGKMFDVRPLKLFMEDVEWKGQRMMRFTPITDSGLITQLKKKVNEMYKENE